MNRLMYRLKPRLPPEKITGAEVSNSATQIHPHEGNLQTEDKEMRFYGGRRKYKVTVANNVTNDRNVSLALVFPVISEKMASEGKKPLKSKVLADLKDYAKEHKILNQIQLARQFLRDKYDYYMIELPSQDRINTSLQVAADKYKNLGDEYRAALYRMKDIQMSNEIFVEATFNKSIIHHKTGRPVIKNSFNERLNESLATLMPDGIFNPDRIDALRSEISMLSKDKLIRQVVGLTTWFARNQEIVNLIDKHTDLTAQATTYGRRFVMMPVSESVELSTERWKLEKTLNIVSFSRQMLDARHDKTMLELETEKSKNAAYEAYTEMRNKHPEWFTADGEFTRPAGYVSGVIASHRKFYLEKKSLPKVGIYNFRGQHDEVNKLSPDGTVAGKSIVARNITIRRVTLEDRNRLDLWRQAHSAGKYNAKQTYNDEAGITMNAYCNLKLPVSVRLYMIAVTIALAVRSFVQRIIPSAAENWEILDQNWNVIPLVSNPINLSYYISKPINALADVIQETVYALGSVEFKPAFLGIPNKYKSQPQESSMARENLAAKKHSSRYFLWQPNLALMHTIIGGKWVHSEKLDVNEDGAPIRKKEPEFYNVLSFLVGRNGYFVVDGHPQPLNNIVETFKDMPFVGEDGAIVYVESVKQFPERQKIEHQELTSLKSRGLGSELNALKKNWQPAAWSEEDTVAFNSVDTSGLEVPQVIDAPHVPLDTQAFEIDEEIISDSEPSEISVKVPDEIIMPAYRKLDVRIRDVYTRVIEAGELLDEADHNRYSIMMWGTDDDIDMEKVADDLSACLEQFLDKLEIKAEPYLAALFRTLIQLRYGNFHAVTLFPIHGINEDIAMQLYMALLGIGIQCAPIKVPHHNFAGSSKHGYGEQLSYIPVNSEVVNNAGDGLLFEAQAMFSKHRDLKWMVISNAIPVLGKLNGTQETYIAATCIFAADEFMSTSYIALPAKIVDTSKVAEGDFSELPNYADFTQVSLGGKPLLLPHAVSAQEILKREALQKAA